MAGEQAVETTRCRIDSGPSPGRGVAVHHHAAGIGFRADELQPAEATLVEDAAAAAQNRRVDEELELVDQPGGDQRRGETGAAENGDVAALAGLEGVDVTREFAAGDRRALPARGL